MGLKTLRLVVTLALVILTAPLVAHAQPSTKVHRTGRLVSGFPPSEPSQGMSAVQQGLRALGYVEGQNLVIEHRYAEGRLYLSSSTRTRWTRVTRRVPQRVHGN